MHTTVVLVDLTLLALHCIVLRVSYLLPPQVACIPLCRLSNMLLVAFAADNDGDDELSDEEDEEEEEEEELVVSSV